MASLIRNTVHMIAGRLRNKKDIITRTATIELVYANPQERVVSHVDTPRVRTSPLKRPKQFAFLTVHVPGEDERHALPDLPKLVFEVYPCLPTEEAFGSTWSVSLKRLEHVKLLDRIAYKISVAQGVCTPMPPKLRA